MKTYASHVTPLLLLGLLFVFVITPTSGSNSKPLCPSKCTCSRHHDPSLDPDHSGLSADCSGQFITDIKDITTELSDITTILDLRKNLIRRVQTDAFSAFPNLAVLWLDSNLIDVIEPHAFRGLHHIRLLNLSDNALRIIRPESFALLSGTCGRAGEVVQEVACNGGGEIRLEGNDISKIERHAFAWMKRLDVFIGSGQVPLFIEPYAFYGARSIRQLRIARVPRLTLQPRSFTNTEQVESVEIADTSMTSLSGFVFEGLQDAGSISFVNVRLALVASYAFGGVKFATSSVRSARKTKRDNDYDQLADDSDEEDLAGDSEGGREITAIRQRTHRNFVDVEDRGSERFGVLSGSGSSLVNFTDCDVEDIQADVWRDTHIVRIHMERCRLGRIAENAFRGVSGLKSISLVRNTMTSPPGRGALGGLRGLYELILDGNMMATIKADMFFDTNDIESIWLVLAFNTTFESDAFAGIFNLKTLQIRGVLDNSGIIGKPTLTVKPGAFRSLVGVDLLRISDVHMHALERNSFAGMSRIKNAQFVACDIARIDRFSFGKHHSHIERVDMSVGNNMTCDCSTAAVLSEISPKFASAKFACLQTTVGVDRLLTIVDDAMLARLSCGSAAISRRTGPISNGAISSLNIATLRTSWIFIGLLILLKVV